MTKKQFIPVALLFVIINLLLFGLKNLPADNFITKIGMNQSFILGTNIMLFGVSLLNYLRVRKMDPNNPSAMVRSVMLGTLLKMMIFAIAALVYAKTQTVKVGIPTLLISMGLYLIYTWLEIRWTNKKK